MSARPNSYSTKITLQLHNAKTGKLEQVAHTNNFVANQTIRYAKWQQRLQYKTGLSTLGAPDTDYSPHPATDAIVLTDSTLTPDPSGEWTMPGALVGYATKAAYAGTDTYRGTPNANQLDAQTSYTKWVFDWPTHACNGTINSVGWVACPAYRSETDGSGPRFLSSCTIEQTWSSGQTWRYFARASTNLSFGNLANTVIYVLNSSYQQDTTFNVSGQFSAVRGLAWDSGNSFLWVIGDNGGARRIAAYNSSGVLQTGPHTITTRSYIALAYDGTKLWSVTQDSNQNHTAYSISTTDGSDVSNFTFTTYYSSSSYPGADIAVGLCWDSTTQRLWVRTHSARSGNATGYVMPALYAFDTSGNRQAVSVALNAWLTSTAQYAPYYTVPGALWQYSSSTYFDFDVIDSYQFAMPMSTSVHRVRIDGLGTRAKLDSPVIKNNTQTLKVIYQINYT